MKKILDEIRKIEDEVLYTREKLCEIFTKQWFEPLMKKLNERKKK